MLPRILLLAGGSRVGAVRPSEASAAAEVPDDFICPITTEIMTDPVTTQDGFTYEREAITEWLRTKDTEPTTGATLESKKLIPNHLVRGMIRSFTDAAAAAAAQPLPAVSPSAGDAAGAVGAADAAGAAGARRGARLRQHGTT